MNSEQASQQDEAIGLRVFREGLQCGLRYVKASEEVGLMLLGPDEAVAAEFRHAGRPAKHFGSFSRGFWAVLNSRE